jgi:hypothetical protein
MGTTEDNLIQRDITGITGDNVIQRDTGTHRNNIILNVTIDGTILLSPARVNVSSLNPNLTILPSTARVNVTSD